MQNLYDADYFENGIVTGKSLYTNYQWMPELTIPMCCELKQRLELKQTDKILDFGCAKGFMVKALCLLGLDAYGYDISAYALHSAPSELEGRLFTDLPPVPFDWVISKDVFEHVPYEKIGVTLEELNCKKIFVAVPLGKKGKYEVPAYELDTTHIIREPLDWWRERLEDAGFKIKYAGYSFGSLKRNWAKYPQGNGFFIGEMA